MSKFVKMQKDGERIEVNPVCVDDHKRLGWNVVGEAPSNNAPEAVEPQAEGKKGKKSKDKGGKKSAETDTSAGE